MTTNDDRSRGLVGSGWHLPYNPNLKDRAKELKRNMTDTEKKLWYGYLKDCDRRFSCQHPIDNYIVDFYSASIKLIIELDGGQHYTEEGKTYDGERDAVLESYGLTVMRFTNTEVMEHFSAVCQDIQNLF